MAVPRRSTKIQVIAILNLIGGFLGLIGSLFAVIGLFVIASGGFGGGAAGGPPNAVAIQKYLVANAPGYMASQIAEVAIGLLFDLMLIASGFGLLWYQNWGRITAVTWAVLSLIHKIAYAAYTLVVVLPTMSRYLDGALANFPPAERDTLRMSTTIGGYGGLCLGLVLAVYPIVVLCMMLSKSAKQAVEPGVRYDDDHDRPDDFDRPRERFDDRERRRDDDDRFRARGEEGDRY